MKICGYPVGTASSRHQLNDRKGQSWLEAAFTQQMFLKKYVYGPIN